MSICLTCLKPTAIQSTNSIHKTLKLKISEILTYCITVKLEDYQNYPESICTDCLATLTLIYEFKRRVLNNLTKLETDRAQHESARIEQKPQVDEHAPSEADAGGEATLEASPAPRGAACELCGKRFADRRGVQKHRSRMHLAARHACAECGKSFLNPWNLKVHMRTHTGEKPYKCELCEKAFNVKCSLRTHYDFHAGVKKARKYACSLCEMSFQVRMDLEAHLVRHTGEKRFRCGVCGKEFVRERNLKRHQAVSEH